MEAQKGLVGGQRLGTLKEQREKMVGGEAGISYFTILIRIG